MPSSSMKVALTGGSGFVGRHVLAHLSEHGHQVTALLRDPDKLTSKPGNLHVVKGDLFDKDALKKLVENVDAVLHLVGIIDEKPNIGQTFERVHYKGTKNLVDAAKDAGVKRWVHMSALGTRPSAVANYHITKWLAEESVRGSGMDYTIFRPSLIHGHDGEFMMMVKNFWCGAFPPVVPFFAEGTPMRDIWEFKKAFIWPFPSLRHESGPPPFVSSATAGKLQPVYIEDVAECFAAALTNEKTIGETYPMGGPQAYTWPKFYETCKKSIRNTRNKKICALPAWYAKMIAGMPGVPFNKDQVIMSQEDSTCLVDKVEQHFDTKMTSLEDALREYGDRIK